MYLEIYLDAQSNLSVVQKISAFVDAGTLGVNELWYKYPYPLSSKPESLVAKYNNFPPLQSSQNQAATLLQEMCTSVTAMPHNNKAVIITDASTTYDTFMRTPSQSPPPVLEQWCRQDLDTAPCPEYSYLIKVKGTNRAITRTPSGDLGLEDTNGQYNHNNIWFCKDFGIFIGFYNKAANVYLGHDNKGGMMAKVHEMKDWERLAYRKARDGGYMFLSAHWKVQKKYVNAVDGTTRLAREDHLHTLWEFEEV